MTNAERQAIFAQVNIAQVAGSISRETFMGIWEALQQYVDNAEEAFDDHGCCESDPGLRTKLEAVRTQLEKFDVLFAKAAA